MGGGQPFLYDARAPVQYSQLDSGFNPKAVSQASWAPPPLPKPKQEAPLINFNRHPDSYIAQPYGQIDFTPMSPSTKSRIKWTRGFQLASRILQLLGGLGLLVLVISIKGASDNQGWILKLPVIIDILTSLYAIYHLSHRINGRTPASSASYHCFALIIDTGLVPFYFLITWLGKLNFEQAPGTNGRWRTLFPGDSAATTVLEALWLTAIIVGALHIISFFMDVYLLITYKRISQLPADMNPLEDNLTSRRKSKHKYKNSSVSDFNDKRFSQITGTAMNNSSTNRLSRAQDPLMYAHSNASGIGFLQSRAGNDTSFNPHNPETARLSRVSLADTYPASRIRSPMPNDNISMGKRSSVAMSIPVLQDEPEQRYDDQVSEVDDSDNWRALDDDDKQSEASYDPYRAKSLRHTPEVAAEVRSHYEPLAQTYDNYTQQEPLRMNPPTPSPPATPLHMNSPLSQLSRRYQEHDKENDRTHTMASDVSAFSETEVSAAQMSSSSDASKSRFYSDLAAAMRGVRQNGDPAPRAKSMIGSVHNAGSDVSSLPPSAQPGYRQSPVARGQRDRPKSYVDSVIGTVIKKPAEGGETERGSPRVVSRSGVDYADADGDLGLGRARDVSGKIAEEGRGGYVRTGLFMRKASGRN
ncbi:Structural maintenance of chromosomes protein 1 [Venturia nashicola]|uniref:Structural maintenance of chromosomes protein 1 n=1 Tax=Venturia nashicola TaxID=86259 RepID=A0A4Z1PCH9_9PEZI|nr:Structural maintenance of chromosomes protein 1 [Venturia nashicola]